MEEKEVKLIEDSIGNINAILNVINVYCEYNEDEEGTIFLLPILENMRIEVDKILKILEW